MPENQQLAETQPPTPDPVPPDLPPSRQAQLIAVLENERNHYRSRFGLRNPTRFPQGLSTLDESLRWRGNKLRPKDQPRRKREATGGK